MPNPSNSPSVDQLVADLAKLAPDWPPEFTEEDKRFFTAVDAMVAGIVADVSQSVAVAALKRRQEVFTAVLAARLALN